MAHANVTGSAAPGDVKLDVKEGGAALLDIDFKKISQEEAFTLLKATHHGLTSEEVKKRLEEFGPNKLPESSRNPLLVFLGYMWNPLAWAMETAAIISICLLDYADFALIVSLLLANATISFIEESNADKAIKALAAALAPKARAIRDGKAENIDASQLVPGDIVIVMFGNIVPADIKILGEEGDADNPLQVDQAALTGESLPVKKFPGDVCFSGSTIKMGERHCVVYATGVNTFFGRAATLLNSTHSVSNIQKVMNRIGFVCLFTIFTWVTIELCVQFGHYHHACTSGEEGCPTLVNMLVIIVGGIPIAMPVVLTVTLALGAAKLAKEGAIVARMSAVEEMASMDVLCSDKTGTLTLNKLSVEKGMLMCGAGYQLPEVLRLGALSANIVSEEPIDMVLHHSCEEKDTIWKQWTSIKFTPFNPTDKYTINMVKEVATGRVIRIMKGAPHVVVKKAHNCDEIKPMADEKIKDFAGRGFRALGIAKMEGDGSDPNSKWEFVGLVPLYDPPRVDTKDTIDKCRAKGIRVKMITGDHLLIGKETARQLGMGQKMYTTEALIKAKAVGAQHCTEMVEGADGFAEVFPEHKFEIVEILQNAGHICGMTGDGVNDAPALKKADVGIAVAGATDAARGAADIVLTEAGLSTIVSAVIGARKIFARMTTYAKYTVSVTIRICFTFGLLTVIYDFYFPTLLIVLLAVFNDGAMIALAKDKVVGSPVPTSWNLKSIFITGFVYGLYLTLSTWVLYQLFQKTSIFSNRVKGYSLDDRYHTRWEDCTKRILPDYERVTGITFKADFSDSVCKIPTYAKQIEGCPGQVHPTVLEQCLVEQKYVKNGMMRSLLYLQVSISGQALIFVVRNPAHSLTVVAGRLTYIAFIVAQAAATFIAAFGFGGYVPPKHHYENCRFCYLSGRDIASETDVHFWGDRGKVPISGTLSENTSSTLGCTWYIVVAWIWSAMWYIVLDPIKWMMMWILNEDGVRKKADLSKPKEEEDKPVKVMEEIIHHEAPIQRVSLERRSQASNTKKFETDGVMAAPGMVAPSFGNPMGRVSVKPTTEQLQRASIATVRVSEEIQPMARQLEQRGLAQVSAEAKPALGRISRTSAPLRLPRTSGNIPE